MAIRAIPRSIRSTGSNASPFAETRNYVQRVMENLQVYRVRFEGSMMAAKADARVVTQETNAAPVPTASAAQ